MCTIIPRSPCRHQALTLIELMMAVSIVLILMGMVFATLSVIRSNQRQAETQVTMNQLSMALATYLDVYGQFGESGDGTDFVANPVDFLVHRRAAVGLSPLFTLTPGTAGTTSVDEHQRYEMVNDPLPGVRGLPIPGNPSPISQATHIMDSFGDPIAISILRRYAPGSTTIQRPSVIILSSSMGIHDEDGNRLEYYYNDGDIVSFASRYYPHSDGTWDLFDNEKWITETEYVSMGGGGGGGGQGKGKGR